MKLSELIADNFIELYTDIVDHKYTHFWLKGGRGSTKSSFISLAIVLLMVRNTQTEAIIFRKVDNVLRTSVFEQMLWAFDKLGLSNIIETRLNPLSITFKESKQRILFRGLDEPTKIKSIKSATKYFGIGWFEELNEFNGMEEIRKVQQSLIRGNNKFWQFYSYNPPMNKNDWVNEEADIERADRIVHNSNYLDVPPSWLGRPFFIEAEHLKKTNERAYRQEYLGEITGTGGTIFPNVVAEPISDETIKRFDNIRQGIDWGYMHDPFAYIKLHYDKKHRTIYLFDEIYKLELSNYKASELIKKKEYKQGVIIADSSEPKSIAELKRYGHYIRPAEKGQGSVEYGIKFLQSMEKIVIDKNRCPNAYREFSRYELERNRNGEFKPEPPDKDNHEIDACRYSLEKDMKQYAW